MPLTFRPDLFSYPYPLICCHACTFLESEMRELHQAVSKIRTISKGTVKAGENILVLLDEEFQKESAFGKKNKEG